MDRTNTNRGPAYFVVIHPPPPPLHNRFCSYPVFVFSTLFLIFCGTNWFVSGLVSWLLVAETWELQHLKRKTWNGTKTCFTFFLPTCWVLSKSDSSFLDVFWVKHVRKKAENVSSEFNITNKPFGFAPTKSLLSGF